MKNLKEMLKAMKDKQIDALAAEIWDAYQDDGEDGIAAALDVEASEALRMLDYSVLDEFPTSADLADAMRVYREDGSEEAFLRAELRRIKAREAEIKARLKELVRDNEEEVETIDPYKVFKDEGEEGLREKLETLSIESLKRIIKMNRFDTAHRSAKWKEDKLVSLIVSMTKSRATRGDVFRNYVD